MVIIDGMRLPPKKIMMSMAVLVGLIIITAIGFLYKQRAHEEEMKRLQQQKIQKEKNDRSSYESSLNEIFNSANVNESMNLYQQLKKDFMKMKAAGWNVEEVFCNKNLCNIQYKRIDKRVFEYVTVNKDEESFNPIFNEDQLTYENIVYNINLESNKELQSDIQNVITCTNFLSRIYELNTLLPETIGSIALEMPSEVFNLSVAYDWAVHKDMKKGVIKYKTPEPLNISFINDKFKGQILSFDQMIMKTGNYTVSYHFYCF